MDGVSYRDNGENDYDAENDLPPFFLSPPEVSLLRSAEENPLEYTMAETDDAVSYVKILLKMLDQVSNAGSSAISTLQPSGSSSNSNSKRGTGGSSILMSPNRLPTGSADDENILTLDTPVFSEDDAFDLYYRSTKQHKRLVVAHYCVTKIYEILCVSLDSKSGIPSVSELFHGGSVQEESFGSGEDSEHGGLHTIHLEKDDWRPLLKLLYNRSSDEYTKRGSALILAYILKAGCEITKKQASSSSSTTTKTTKPDEDLLDLFLPTPPTPLAANRQQAASSDVLGNTLESFITWLTTRLQYSGTYASLSVVTPTLGVLMSTTKEARLAFVSSGGIGYISRHLKEKRRRPQPLRSSPATTSPNHGTPRSPTTQAVAQPRPSPQIRHRRTSSKTQSVFDSLSAVASTGYESMSAGLSELDLAKSVEGVEKNLDSMYNTASEAGTAVLASLTTSTTATAPLVSPTRTTSSSSSVQQLYDLVFCLWCLSLDCATDESVQKHFARDGAVPALAHLLKRAPRVKVLRMTLACLRSLSVLGSSNNGSNEHPFVRDMIGCGIVKSLETVLQRRWNDPDLEDDLKFMKDFLSDKTKELTQFSAYEAQINTGILRWDDMFHKHDFFRDNAMFMEGKRGDFAPLRRLVDVLYSNTTSGKLRSSGRAKEISYEGLNEVSGWDEDDLRDDDVCESLAVCLFDIGEFARNYPNGKAVLGSRCGISAKALIMQYVQHPRDEVREQAVLCASKLLVRNWRLIGEFNDRAV